MWRGPCSTLSFSGKSGLCLTKDSRQVNVFDRAEEGELREVVNLSVAVKVVACPKGVGLSLATPGGVNGWSAQVEGKTIFPSPSKY
jgi:hypothetical protein